MPSRLSWVRYQENLVNQWPLANITQQAGTLTININQKIKNRFITAFMGQFNVRKY